MNAPANGGTGAQVPVVLSSAQPPAQQELFAGELTWFHVLKPLVAGGALRRMGPYASMVYLALKSYTNLQTGRAFPSITTIANDTGISERQVLRAIRILERQNMLHTRRNGRRNEYQFREQVPLLNSKGQHVADASWDYVPQALQAAITKLRASLGNSNVSAQQLPSGNLVINVIQAKDNATVNIQQGEVPLAPRSNKLASEPRSAGQIIESVFRDRQSRTPRR